MRVAEAVFAERGYAGARMADVAERVGIRRASLVHYFPDKRSLYEALLDDLFGDLRGRYESELAGPGSLQERMLRCVDAWAEQVERRPGLLRISLWEMARATPTEDVPLASRVRPIVQQLADVVREGQQAGVFQQVDPVGFVMSVPGTTAFLGLRTDLLGAEIAAPQEPGGLKADLRRWVARVLFVDEAPAGASAQRVAR